MTNTVNIPDLGDPLLWYETGIHVGDGSMGVYDKSTYVYGIYGNNKTERKFFNATLIPTVNHLYGIKPVLRNNGNTCMIIMHSKHLVMFKNKILGLPLGPKNKIKLPNFIAKNGTDAICYFIAGLFDTDGQVKITKKDYVHLRITQKDEDLLAEIKNFLGMQGVPSCLYKHDYFDVRVNKIERRWFLEINGSKNVKAFLELIPIRNPCYLKKLERFFSGRARV
jgi:hypothetical protein